MLSRQEEAHREYIAVFDLCGEPCSWAQAAQAAMEQGWAEGGFEGSARALIETAAGREGVSPVATPLVIAALCATIGETDEAFAWLERGDRDRDPLMVLLKAHPWFDPMRSDPRFQDLLRRINYPGAS
jgi:hypothetical protein